MKINYNLKLNQEEAKQLLKILEIFSNKYAEYEDIKKYLTLENLLIYTKIGIISKNENNNFFFVYQKYYLTNLGFIIKNKLEIWNRNIQSKDYFEYNINQLEELPNELITKLEHEIFIEENLANIEEFVKKYNIVSIEDFYERFQTFGNIEAIIEYLYEVKHINEMTMNFLKILYYNYWDERDALSYFNNFLNFLKYGSNIDKYDEQLLDDSLFTNYIIFNDK
ncbi:MAG: hypothetical protein LBM96_06010 [Methanobrevibacter sp.]|jgi:hypothetical protein|nr:hypothetical protein [Candidatus Methanoflexus mossambicus]